MIPCDAACFGAAGAELGIEFVSQELQLDSALVNNGAKWVDFNNAYVNFATQYANDKIDKYQDFVQALDGVAKKLMFSVELLAQAKVNNVDNISANYLQIRKNSKKADLIIRNAMDFKSPYASFKGEWLLAHCLERVERYLSNNKSQIELSAPLLMANHSDFNMTDTEKALYLTRQPSPPEQAGVTDVAKLLTQQQLSAQETHSLAKSLTVLFIGPKVDSKVDSKVDQRSPHSRNKKSKQLLALSLLVNSLVLNKNDSDILNYHSDNIAMTLASDRSGANKRLLPHALNEEIVYTQALTNVMLNQYLQQKRLKNAVSAINTL